MAEAAETTALTTISTSKANLVPVTKGTDDKGKSDQVCCVSKHRLYILACNFFLPLLVIASVGAIAHWAKLPFIFPSLGPTAFLHFALPDKPPASPKNTLLGHLIGILAGSFALQVTDLYTHENVLMEGVLPARIICASLSVAITCCGMILFNVPHPPAGATTLIVSLGLITTPTNLACMMGAVSILTVEAFVLNRILRKDAIYPWWRTDSWCDNRRSSKVEAEESMATKLDNEMRKLSTDNIGKCFELCNKTQNGVAMAKLLRFAADNLDVMRNDAIPFALRVALKTGHTSIQV